MIKRSRSIIEHWNRFWFSREPRGTLCLLRLFIGIVLIMKLTGSTGFLMNMDLNPEFPEHVFSSERTYRIGAYRQPVPGFGWLPVPSYQNYLILEEVLLLFAVFFAAGFLFRFTGPLLALLYGYFFVIDQMGYHHHVFLFVLVLFVLGFTNCSSRYSVDYIVGERISGPNTGIAMPRRMLQIIVTCIYFFGALSKLNQGWFSGEIIEVFYLSGAISGPLRSFIADYDMFSAISISTIFVESFLALGIWVGRLRRTAVFFGVLMHLLIDLTINVSTFSFQMIVLYCVFAAPGVGRNIVYIDGSKRSEYLSLRLLMFFDWLRRLKISETDYNSGDSSRTEGRKNKKSIVIEKPDGSSFSGIYAYINILGLLPMLFPLGWVLNLFVYIRSEVYPTKT